MRRLKAALIVSLATLLLACGGPPAEGDIRGLLVEQMQSEAKQLSMLGVDLSEILEVSKVKVLNSVEDGKKAYVVEVESTLRFKKSIGDLREFQQQLIMSMTFGDFKAGQETPPSKSKFRVLKGDKGWMLADK